MLRAGVMEGELFKKTTEGTPQGGVVSPLLANIYLHELDAWFHRNYTGLNYNEKNRRRKRKLGNAFYVRYADDFVVAWSGPKAGAEALKAELATFLREHLGLELSAEKTHITHVTDGYDFLGFTVKREIDAQRGYNKLLFYPSKASVMKVKAKLKSLTKRGTTLASPRDKISALNYLLRGWANYFRHSVASQTFDYVGHYAFKRTEIWLGSKTTKRRWKKAVYRRYYRRHEGYMTWQDGGVALYHPGVATRITYLRYTHRPNPYLSPQYATELPYHLDPLAGKGWTGTHPYGEEGTDVRDRVRRRDGNRCRLCGSTDRVEVHHARKYKPGMRHDPARMAALCATCHRQLRDPQSEASRLLARLHLDTGKPDAAKAARPVWEGA
jgi:RNA-directed DNA polymerase